MSARNRDVRRYIDAEVKPDKKEAQIRREIATGATKQIRAALPNAGAVQYTGSNYEGNATKNSSDFDVMVDAAPKDGKFQMEYTDKRPDFAKLKYLSGADDQYVDKCVTSDGYLSGKNVIQKEVLPAVDRLIGVQNHGGSLNVNGREVSVEKSVGGPAITLDLKSGSHKTQLEIVTSVDKSHVVGGSGKVDYAAMPSKSQSDEGLKWRESYSSIQEKELFKGADAGNQVHREVLKTAKTVKASDDSFSGMRGYVMKTAEMNLMCKDEQRVSQGTSPKSWRSADTADRLQDLGKELYQGLDKGEITVTFNRNVNVLEGTTEEKRAQWKEAIGKDGVKLVEKATPGYKP